MTHEFDGEAHRRYDLPPASYARAAEHLANARQIAERIDWLRERQASLNARIAALAAVKVLPGNNRGNRHE